jgi:hypothetical protein
LQVQSSEFPSKKKKTPKSKNISLAAHLKPQNLGG